MKERSCESDSVKRGVRIFFSSNIFKVKVKNNRCCVSFFPLFFFYFLRVADRDLFVNFWRAKTREPFDNTLHRVVYDLGIISV